MSITKTILIIEDEPALHRLLSTILTRQGYKTTGAFSGEEALARASEQPFDLITLDLRLPDMTGNEILLELARRGVTTPVIVVSGTPEALTIVTEQVKAVVRKPFTLTDLTTALKVFEAGPVAAPPPLVTSLSTLGVVA